jgi:hypothetical protein
MSAAERPVRTRLRLRGLVEEMLASIRVAANQDLWTPEERARYEADMAAIMAQVRAEALARPEPDGR